MESKFKNTGVQSIYTNDDKFRFFFQNNNNKREGPSSWMGNNHVKRGERKIVHDDISNLCSWSVSHYLPTGDFHGSELTKTNERNILKSILGILGGINCG